ncbi:FAD-dependent oxidoreductase [Campylobacter geochelonis]|uniref:FAD binding domain-containing protein n=1 Tax=Campylobacter geochelonis TaxID=1780362 RepID=A0A128EKB9_9BACT|nr:flavocytochrome c [Campylobacter geochelonis]QKF71287.1 flavocytochrome c [Campylobacter geochelonis]CZE48119.1 FAD binding domain-containing protein [Campylobacter geochelonis]CZE49001.1 FAD binding domain-containing protein [Campylobacter geochelonis]
MERRNFIKFSLGSGAFALASNLNADTTTSKNEPKFDGEWDVIVVGSGISGHICATYLAKNGKKVLMIEKMNRVGGNSALSQQDFAVMGSDLQKRDGIKDSVELFLKDLNNAGKGYNHTEQSLRVIKNSNEAYEFAKSCGIKYSDKLKFLGGHSVARTVQTLGGGGAAIQSIHKTFMENGGEFINECKADEILKDENGRVVGVSVRVDYRFDRELKNDDRENKSGVRKTFRAKDAVIFATGGYSRDVEFRTIMNPRLKRANTPSNLGQTAGALKMMLAAGATPVQLCLTRFSFGIPTEDLLYGIMVDKNSDRFLNEDGDRQGLSDKILAHMDKIDTYSYPVAIFDSVGFGNSHDPKRMQSFMQSGKMKEFATLEKLCEFYKLPLENLEKTIKKYNENIAKNADEFKKDANKLKGSTIAKAPYYAIFAAPGLSYTQGGVWVNTDMQVISLATNEPINGFYAVGEATGGTHGASRLTSCSIPDCMTSGLLAAKAILKA